MPVIWPFTSAVNFTPTSTLAVSVVLGFAGVADGGQIVQTTHPPAAGVTAFEAADAGPVPTALVAATRNVYAVPLVSPVTVVLVAGGVPVTVRTGCAVVPTNGVMV